MEEALPCRALHFLSSCMHLISSSAPPLHFFIVSLLLLSIALLSAFYYGKGANCGYDRRKLPPGSFGLPLGIGETLQFAFNNTCPIGTPPPFFSSRLRKYGTVFKTHLLGCPTVVSMDPDLNKLLLSNEDKLVQVSFPRSIKMIVGTFFSLDSQQKRHFRKLFNSILNPYTLQVLHFIPIQQLTCSMFHPWVHLGIFDAQQELKKFTLTYIMKSLFGLVPEDPNIELLMRNYLVVTTGYSAMPLDLPGTTFNKVLKARKRIITILNSLVQAQRKDIISEPGNFVELLLKETDEYGNHFRDEYIVELAFAFILGGFDNTSVLLTNVVKFLSENAHVVEELQKEHAFIRRNKKANELVAWDDLKQMEFTQLVIKETLRIASIAHSVPREALQDIFFKDMVIPKGWKIFINFSMVHLNPSHFTNPLKFDPWRWKDTKSNNEDFFTPFSGGIRICPGSSLAKIEASIFIHYLVTTYKWDRILEVGGQLDVVSSLSVPSMKKGLLIKVEPL